VSFITGSLVGTSKGERSGFIVRRDWLQGNRRHYHCAE
jgi:hypothetical protein